MSVQLGQVDLAKQIESAVAAVGGFSDLASQSSQLGGNLLSQLEGSIPGTDLLTPNITNLNLNAVSAELTELNEFLSMIQTKIANLLTPSLSFAPFLRLPPGTTQLQLAADLQSIQAKIAVALALYALVQSLKSSGSNKSVEQAQAEQAAQAAAAAQTTNTLISSTTTEFFNTSVT